MTGTTLISTTILLLGLLTCLPVHVHAQAVPGCGNLQNAYGPFDYNDPVAHRENLPIVEQHHLSSEILALRDSNSIGHLDYTLRAFPNHPRALNSLARYALQGGHPAAASSIRSLDCYFRRAITFRADDATVRMIYANYLFKRGDMSGAKVEYEEALRLAPGAPEVNYNAGLYFAQVGDLARAKQLAKVAYDGGYPLPGLHRIISEAERQGDSK